METTKTLTPERIQLPGGYYLSRRDDDTSDKDYVLFGTDHGQNHSVEFYDNYSWINNFADAMNQSVKDAADLRAQLAEKDALIQKHLSTLTELEAAVKERDAQLAAERARLHELLERSYGILENVAIAETGDAEQDAFERETFEDVKKELGK